MEVMKKEKSLQELFLGHEDLSREIKEMRTDRIKESPRRFHLGESPGISQHWNDQPVNQPQVSQRSNIPTYPLKTNFLNMSLKIRDSRRILVFKSYVT